MKGFCLFPFLFVVFPVRFLYLIDMIKVVVGVIIKNDEILLCRRKKSARYPLKWEFPGGKVEDSEPLEESLKRELREELEIDAEVGALFHHQQWVYPDSGKYEVAYYFIPRYSGEMINHAFESFRWVALDDVQQYDVLEGNREVIDKLIKMYESQSAGSR